MELSINIIASNAIYQEKRRLTHKKLIYLFVYIENMDTL